MSIIKEILELEKAMHNRSAKPAARLRASLAATRRNYLLSLLPGSARRGLERGHMPEQREAPAHE